MAGHQGLHKVVKTVKGKKGSAHRAYWVKNEAGPAAHPGILHRAAVGAGKLALAGAAAAATVAVAAYGAHKLSSHLAAHGGGGPNRGVVRHATDHAALAHLKASSTVAHHTTPVRERVQDFVNIHKASRSAARTRATDSSNIRKAAAHAAKRS